MIYASHRIKIAAATTAICIHGAVAIAFMPPTSPVEMEGQSGGQDAQIGTAFADMSAGSVSASPAADIQTPTPPTEAPIRPTQPQTQPQMQPVSEIPAVTPPETPVTSSVPITPITPLAPSPTPIIPTVTPIVPTTSTAAPQTVAKILQATPEAPAPDLKAHKPAPRPERPKPAPKKVVKSPPKAATAPRGNAKTSARAGQADGTKNAKSTSKGTSGKKKTAGNAAISNYPGQVMRKLSRVSRPRVSTKGVAVVSFKVSANGAISALSLSRSSGSAELDRAALNVVQRAAPFPAPPEGAKRSFAVEIKGR